MPIVASLLIGLLFGLGLMISGMSDPAKVIGFLDLAGPWDPSLALVMAAAIALGSIGFHFAGRRKTALLGMPMQLPAAGRIDQRLMLGSASFGVGWGLAGICPGPGIVLLAIDADKGGVFVVALLLGMGIFELQQGLRDKHQRALNISN